MSAALWGICLKNELWLGSESFSSAINVIFAIAKVPVGLGA